MISVWTFLPPSEAQRLGEWAEHSGPLLPGQAGMTGHMKLVHALLAADGPFLCAATLDGETRRRGTALAARRRRIDRAVDASAALAAFARQTAAAHLEHWTAPAAVRWFIFTGYNVEAARETLPPAATCQRGTMADLGRDIAAACIALADEPLHAAAEAAQLALYARPVLNDGFAKRRVEAALYGAMIDARLLA